MKTAPQWKTTVKGEVRGETSEEISSVALLNPACLYYSGSPFLYYSASSFLYYRGNQVFTIVC
jgi:hypothetical protein